MSKGYLDFIKAVKPAADGLQKVIQTLMTAPGAANDLTPTNQQDIDANTPGDAGTKLKGGSTEDENWMKDKQALIYPQNLFSPGNQAYILFLMRDSNLRSAEVYKRIGMYMPPAIKVAYGTNWEEINMPVEQAVDFGRDAVDSTMSAFSSNESDRATAGQFATSAVTKGAANLADVATGGEAFGNYRDIKSRNTTNPHQALLFKGVSFREFQFSFEFLARNKEESESIRQIIKTFKWGMHPGGAQDASFWDYPNTFDIYLLTPSHKYMFNISQCVLTAMDVDYGGSQATSFFKVTGAPVHINMNLTFKELSVLTKKLIEEDY